VIAVFCGNEKQFIKSELHVVPCDVFVPAADAEAATLALVDCMATELGGVEIVADPAVPSFYWQDAA
jgi:hypothetical protein